ncbi:dentin sialophosphoprotein isoform X2 [Drosophila persimilis]|uniref:dentin sialophosphoprotein isoform X2 n=1 Tax=Drosophila persimilis TaxID=7234 RepID=UPI000F097582|nr:dentin sialophosphoprotein isoform X2 [Drosophila persimilis]
MSNLLYMDKSNGNGVYAVKPNSSHTDNDNALMGAGVAPTTNSTAVAAVTAAAAAAAAGGGGGVVAGGCPTTLATANNINIMNGAAAAAAASASTLPTSASSEDLSQSLSEYTDADESISAPTEFLAEFLSAVMLKDYKKALKYCKLILQYEPNNSTAKEFYPLILDKLRGAASSDSDENYNKSSSAELALDLHESDAEGDGDGDGSDSSNNCSEEDNGWGDDEIDNVDVEGEEESSSSGDDFELPIDEQQDLAAVDGLAVPHSHSHSHSHSHNDSGSSRNSSSGGGGRSDNTTHSYSSLLLEEEDDIVPISLSFGLKDTTATDLDVSNGNKVPSASCSDSESPTEPLTQRLAAILRSKCGVSSGGNEDPY